MIRKTITPDHVKIVDEDAGEVEAVFATLNVKDKDGDVTLKGAITEGAPIVVSAYGHKSWDGELPVGTGTIHEVGGELVARMKFLMDTTPGADTFRTVKALKAAGLGEWSYGLMDVKAEMGVHDGEKVQFLKQITVPEVSPVLVGAGVNTRTLATKSGKQLNGNIETRLREAGRERYKVGDVSVYVEDFDLDEMFVVFHIFTWGDGPDRTVRVSFTRSGDTVTLGDDEMDVVRDVTYTVKSGATFVGQAESVLAALGELNTRAQEVVALRSAKGKTISDESAGLLSAVADQLKQLNQVLTPQPIEPGDISSEWLRYIANSQGVTTS